MEGSLMGGAAGGEYLVTLRRLAGKRQEDIAAALDVTGRTLSRWENGSYKPSLLNARRLMRVLRGSLESFIDLWDDKNATRSDAVSRASTDHDTALLLDAIKTEDDLENLIREYRRRHPHG